MKEGKSFTSSLIIRPEACCRKGGWQSITILFSSWSMDIKFKDDVAVILFRSVSFMISTNDFLLSWQPLKHSFFIIYFYSLTNVSIISEVPMCLFASIALLIKNVGNMQYPRILFICMPINYLWFCGRTGEEMSESPYLVTMYKTRRLSNPHPYNQRWAAV